MPVASVFGTEGYRFESCRGYSLVPPPSAVNRLHREATAAARVRPVYGTSRLRCRWARCRVGWQRPPPVRAVAGGGTAGCPEFGGCPALHDLEGGPARRLL